MTRAKDTVEIMLMPGDYFVGDARYRIRTVLGSCVSVTLWHPQARIGAMSHFLLAEHGPSQSPSPRYADDAMDMMIAELRKAGIDPRDCHAKIFGGGIMFPTLERIDRPSIGRRNGETAEKLLRQHKIPIVSESLFGVGHRHIIFSIRTGDVWVRMGALGDAGATREPS